jgi:hypothetical protein
LKNFSKLFLILLFLLTAAKVEAVAYDSQFTLSLDLQGLGAFASGGPSGSSLGVGGSFFADWRPLPFLSLGTGMDYTSYSSAGGWQTSSWNLGGRIFPAPSDKDGELYLQGTWGLNLITGSLMKTWPGSFHGSAGIGYRVFMDKGNALDLGGQYDFYSPRKNPLTAIGVKIGWTFLFGGDPTINREASAAKPALPPVVKAPPPLKKSTGKPKKKSVKNKRAAAPVPTPAPEGIVYAWVEGDQLESLAEAFLGRGNLYPLIVDANKNIIGGPAGLVPGVKLTIPDKPTDAQKEEARLKADSPEYLPWAKVGKKF